MLSPKQKVHKGLDYLEEAILDILPADEPLPPVQITRSLGINPMVTATGAKYSSIVITILEGLEAKGKVKSVRENKPNAHRY